MGSPEPVIGLRPATDADSEFYFVLHRATMGPYVTALWGWDDDAQRGFHEDAFDPVPTRIVTVDGQDAGVLLVEDRPTETYLSRIAVDPSHQGRGIGAALLSELLRRGAATGKPVVLDVLDINTRAYALYTRLGFREELRHGPDHIKIQMRWTPDRSTP